MDPLRPIAQILETLSRQRTAEAPQRGSLPAASGKATVDADGGVAPATVEAKLRVRLGAVGSRDRRQLRRQFVETALASELGDSVVLDPAFGALIDRVTADLTADDELTRQLDTTIDALLPAA